MKKVIKFHVDLRREQFGIYGFKNISSLLLFFLVIIFLGKFIQCKISLYNMQALVAVLLFNSLFSIFVFKKYDKRICRDFMFFPELGKKNIEKYYCYRNIIMYLGILELILFPWDKRLMGYFFAWSVINCLLMLVEVLLKKNSDEAKLTYKTVLFIIVLINFHVIIEWMDSIHITRIDILLCMFGLYVVIKKILSEISCVNLNKKYIRRYKLLSKIQLINSNEDLIYLLRSGDLFEELYIVIITLVYVIWKMGSRSDDIFFWFVGGLTATYIGLYYKLLVNDNGKKVFFYKNNKYRFIKLKNILIVSLMYYIPVGLVMQFRISCIYSLLTYILSLLIFSCTIWALDFFTKGQSIKIQKEILIISVIDCIWEIILSICLTLT